MAANSKTKLMTRPKRPADKMFLLLVATITAAFCYEQQPTFNDFHYPTAEAAERASLEVPAACVNGTSSGWMVVSSLPTLCVLQYSFSEWGMMALLPLPASPSKPAKLLRMSVGKLEGIVQPRFNFTAVNPTYFERMSDSMSDYPADIAATLADGQLGFSSLAQTLAPQRDLTEISLNSDVVKFVVSHAGRIKCGKTGLTELEDLHAAAPNMQTVVFDPASELRYWPSSFAHMKSGFVGGHLRVCVLCV